MRIQNTLDRARFRNAARRHTTLESKLTPPLILLPSSEHYRERLERWRSAHARSEKQYRLLVRARLATGLAAVAIAATALGATLISPWWLLAPFIVLVFLVIVHSRVDQARSTEARALVYYERALGRLSDQWIGAGSQGERFRDPKHVYADDLDLFGRGSLFEMLSTARTGAGETTLAHWLLAPGDAKEVIARQASVEELRERVDLREQLALMGEDIRAAVDAKSLGNWGGQPAVPFFRGARVVAAALAALAVLTLALFFAHVFSLLPFLVVLLGELIFNFSIRDSVGRVTAAVSTPAQELFLLGLLFERL